MKFHLLMILLIASLLLIDIASSEKKKGKKYRLHHKKHHLTTEEKLAEEQKRYNEEIQRQEEQAAKANAERAQKEIEENDVFDFDPCSKLRCSTGQICTIDDDNRAKCICIPTCPNESDPRRKVCTNYNETWGSDCTVHQQRCYCNTGDEKCLSNDYKHVHINYYGECREMPTCSEDQMADFPRRMRDWLFNIMLDLAGRRELSKHFLAMEREAENNVTLRWLNAAIWKWCDLNEDKNEGISLHELFPIRAPLLSLEHCIAPFLDNCDANNDHIITIQEWGQCLQLEEGVFEAKCDDFTNAEDQDEE